MSSNNKKSDSYVKYLMEHYKHKHGSPSSSPKVSPVKPYPQVDRDLNQRIREQDQKYQEKYLV
jgi:hypothetical protein